MTFNLNPDFDPTLIGGDLGIPSFILSEDQLVDIMNSLLSMKDSLIRSDDSQPTDFAREDAAITAIIHELVHARGYTIDKLAPEQADQYRATLGDRW